MKPCNTTYKASYILWCTCNRPTLMLTLLHSWVKGVGVKGMMATLALHNFPKLSRDELDLVLIGQISALLSNNQATNSKKARQRSNMAFYHGGVRICRTTFQKLHGTGIRMNYVHSLAHTHLLKFAHTATPHTHTHTGIHTQHIHPHKLLLHILIVILCTSQGKIASWP